MIAQKVMFAQEERLGRPLDDVCAIGFQSGGAERLRDVALSTEGVEIFDIRIERDLRQQGFGDPVLFDIPIPGVAICAFVG